MQRESRTPRGFSCLDIKELNTAELKASDRQLRFTVADDGGPSSSVVDPTHGFVPFGSGCVLTESRGLNRQI